MLIYGIDIETGEITDREMTEEEIEQLPPASLVPDDLAD
jgi:hypothetical protein